MDERENIFLAAVYSIDEYAENIEVLAEGHTFHAYLQDKSMRLAIERCLTVIGEAATRIRKIGKGGEIPEINRIFGFRNLLVHEYDGIDHEQMWGIIKRHIPELRKHTKIILSQNPRPDDFPF